MADKIELIRRRIARTRQALQQKLDVLEDRTLGAVEKTADAVVGVAETVGETVETAKEAVTDTMQKTERFFDLSRHVNRHPWAVMGGAVAAGFAASVLLSRAAPRAEQPMRRHAPTDGRRPPPEQRAAQPSWLSNMLQTFAPQLETLKDLAIGATIAVVRDFALQSAPKEWAHEVGDLFNGLTAKLGGTQLPQQEEEKRQAPESAATSEDRPRWEHDRSGPPPQAAKKKSYGNGRHSESAPR